MSRTVMLSLMVVSGAALAQHKGLGLGVPMSPLPGHDSAAVPFAEGNPFGGDRAPLLRSWVTGWGLTGSKPEAYEVRCDDTFTSCVPMLRTRSGTAEPFGFAALTHAENAAPWRGRRIELRAELRGGRVDGWAGLWMRIDGADGQALAFDNMQNRAVRGTTSFQWYSVVLDVPEQAERLSFGVVLHGPGAVFIRELQFDEASQEVGSSDLLAPLRAQK